MNIFITAIIAVLISMSLVVIRGIVGKTTFDRILAVNSFGTNTVLMIALIGFVNDEMMYMDIAITYALINFIATIAILKYFKFGTLGDN